MKLKLIAASAALLASAAAQAQSTVTLYGVADVGLEYLTKADGKNSVMRMSSGNLSGSRWGLRGTEDLGGGLKAVFTLESGFAIDTGAQEHGGIFGRQAFVGLQGKFGALTMGRHQNLLYDFSHAYDPLGTAPRYSIGRMDKGMVSRSDNSLKYVGTFGALKAGALYSFGYKDNGEKPGEWRDGREASASLGYEAGAFGVSAVYDHRTPVARNKEQRATVGARYDFGPARLYAGYRWAQVTSGAEAARSNLYWLGASYPATTALKLSGAVYYQDYRRTAADPWMFGAQADYALSKRTDLYLSMAYALNRRDKGLVSGLTLGRGLEPSLNPVSAGKKKNQFGAVVGVRHRF